MNEPFFSIIIPVYNTEGLPRCLDSILAQSFDCKEIEIVAVNDGSPNVQQCNEIISLYRTQLNTTYIKLDHNMGTHIARTYGVENSTGRYLLFVDPDDFLTPDALKTLFTDIQVNGDVDYIWFLFSILYQNGKREPSGFVPDIDAKSVLEDMLTFKLSHNVANRCFNASFAKKHCGICFSSMPITTKIIIRWRFYIIVQKKGVYSTSLYTYMFKESVSLE